MAKHAARLGLLALLVFAAAVHVSASLEEVLSTLEGLEGRAAAVTAALGGSDRADKASRSDVTSCWAGKSLVCKITAKCTTSKCDCCGCPCATLGCWFNTLKATYNTAARAAATLKTPAQRKAAAPAFCKAANTMRPLTKDLIKLYRQAQCPKYTVYVKALAGYQANYDKWCKGFRG